MAGRVLRSVCRAVLIVVALVGLVVQAGVVSARAADFSCDEVSGPVAMGALVDGARIASSAAQSYQRNAHGDITRTTDSLLGPTSYTYDPNRQLTSYCHQATPCGPSATDLVKLTYDGSGNRLSLSTPQATTEYTYGSSNELQAITQAHTTRNLTHDRNGNLTDDGTTAYSWNTAGKLTDSAHAGTTTTYGYNGDGRRVWQQVEGQSTQYIWDPLSPQLLQTHTDGEQPSRWLYGTSLLATQAGAGAPSMLTADQVGTPLLASSKSGNNRKQRAYTPFGSPRVTTDTPAPQLPAAGLNGGLLQDNGRYLFNQREYNPQTGRFISPDPAGSTSTYGFAGNNPLANTDLAGLYSLDHFLSDVSTISGYVSTGATFAAVGCAATIVCAPAAPLIGGIAVGSGVISGVSGGILDAKACKTKGNCAGLVTDIAITAAASRIPGLRIAAGARAAAKTGDDFLYRGVHYGHPAYDDAARGTARPWGGHSDPALHNGGNNRSEFTSWTTDESIAREVASEGNGPGIVLRIPNADGPGYVRVPSPDIYGESEVLIRGPVLGAGVLP